MRSAVTYRAARGWEAVSASAMFGLAQTASRLAGWSWPALMAGGGNFKLLFSWTAVVSGDR